MPLWESDIQNHHCGDGKENMEIVETDVAIVGAGGAGLRAAIALAEADPSCALR